MLRKPSPPTASASPDCAAPPGTDRLPAKVAHRMLVALRRERVGPCGIGLLFRRKGLSLRLAGRTGAPEATYGSNGRRAIWSIAGPLFRLLPQESRLVIATQLGQAQRYLLTHARSTIPPNSTPLRPLSSSVMLRGQACAIWRRSRWHPPRRENWASIASDPHDLSEPKT